LAEKIKETDMRLLLVILTLLLSTQLLAHGHKKHNLAAHSHGLVGVDIAVEDKEIFIMLKSPADSFLGFEHKPKNKKQKALIAAAKKIWGSGKLFSIGASCKIKDSKWDLHYEGSHSEIEANIYFICDKNLKEVEMKSHFFEHYKKIEILHVQALTTGRALNNKYKKDYQIQL
jgi:hypothetical protein